MADGGDWAETTPSSCDETTKSQNVALWLSTQRFRLRHFAVLYSAKLKQRNIFRLGQQTTGFTHRLYRPCGGIAKDFCRSFFTIISRSRPRRCVTAVVF
jgi:hypothetical protein